MLVSPQAPLMPLLSTSFPAPLSALSVFFVVFIKASFPPSKPPCCDSPSMTYLPTFCNLLCAALSQGNFGQSVPWVLSGVVDPRLHQSFVHMLFLNCYDQCLCAVPETSLLQPLVCFPYQPIAVASVFCKHSVFVERISICSSE